MKIPRLLNTYRTKWRFARSERKWERSPRRQELDAERDLPPRPLAPEEHELLAWMLEHGSEEAKSFLPQVEGLRAVRGCTCGCPTIHLIVAEEASLGKSDGGRVICDLQGKTAKGEIIGVLLFQDAGKLSSLEVYSLDGEIQNDTQEFGLPVIESLNEFVVSTPSTSAPA